jgi:hypothetical protein
VTLVTAIITALCTLAIATCHSAAPSMWLGVLAGLSFVIAVGVLRVPI